MMKKLLLSFLLTLTLSAWVNADITPLTNTALSSGEYLNNFMEPPPHAPIPLYKFEFKPEGYDEVAGYIAYSYRQSFSSNPTIYMYGFSIVVYENSPISVTKLSLNFGNAPLFFDFGNAEGNSFWGSGLGWDAINTDPYNPPLGASFDNVSNVVSFSDAIGPGHKSSWLLILSAAPLKNILDFKFDILTEGSGTFGVFRPSDGYWYIDLSGNHKFDGCGVDGCYNFGMNGDLPVAGDWNYDGVAEIGVFRPSTGKWYLDLNGNRQWDGCGVDACLTFGMDGDLPVVGDWNGDGIAQIGVFRPSTGKWYLDLNGNRQWDRCTVDGCITFGMDGDLPVVGDWNGDGIAQIGVFRPSTGKWYLDLNGNDQWNGCSVDACLIFGMDGDLPVAGDWNKDGVAEIGVFRPSTGNWYLDLNGNDQWNGCSVDACLTFGMNGDLPVARIW
jgi:hypothetical protein